jgi:hypothetical protein
MGKIGRRFSYLAVSQVLSLLCIPALIFVLVTVYWHQTDNVFAPYGDYVSSFEIAFPPAILFAASYIVVFLTGVPLSEAPRFVIAFFRNRFLQSPRMMAMGDRYYNNPFRLDLVVCSRDPAAVLCQVGGRDHARRSRQFC